MLQKIFNTTKTLWLEFMLTMDGESIKYPKLAENKKPYVYLTVVLMACHYDDYLLLMTVKNKFKA